MPNVFLSGSVSISTVSGSVGASSSVVMNSDPNRIYAAFVNDGVNPVYLAVEEDAVAGSGVRLNATGGSFEINSLNLSVGTVSAITSSGTSSLAMLEMVSV